MPAADGDGFSKRPFVDPFLVTAVHRLGSETRGSIAATSNDALSLATGEFVALLDHDDTLAPEALYLAAVELERNSTLQLIYTDEDKIDEHEQRHSPYFKPEWNLDLFL